MIQAGTATMKVTRNTGCRIMKPGWKLLNMLMLMMVCILVGNVAELNVSQRRQSSVDEQPERKYFYVNYSQHCVTVT